MDLIGIILIIIAVILFLIAFIIGMFMFYVKIKHDIDEELRSLDGD